METGKKNATKEDKKENIIRRVLELLRYTTSSLISITVEYLIYIPLILWALPGHPVICFNISRTVGSTINFAINEIFVFEHPKNGLLNRMFKHYLLVVAIAFIANWMIVLLYDYFGVGEIFSKLITDTTLFFVRLIAQKLWVFRCRKLKKSRVFVNHRRK